MRFMKTPIAIAMGATLSLSANALQITVNEDAVALANVLTSGTGLIINKEATTLTYGISGGFNGDGEGEGCVDCGDEGTVAYSVEGVEGPQPQPVLLNPELVPNPEATPNPELVPTPSGSTTGTFTNASGTYGLPLEGIVLSSGNVLDYQDGPNTQASKGTSWNTVATEEQSDLLKQVSGDAFYRDTTLLTITFDVDENTDKVSFLGAFGSEEYPEYVGSNFIDGFGLFLNGDNIAGVRNEEGELQTTNVNHTSFKPITGTELDGLIAPNGNPLLRFDVPVEKGSKNNVFQIVIGDRGDSAYDTTTYIAKLGGEGSNELIPVMPSNGEPNENGEFEFSLPVAESGLGIDIGNPVWIDPIVSVGYTYEITDGKFTSVVMPGVTTLDSDGFELWVWNPLDGEYNLVTVLENGETYTFEQLAFDVTKFDIRDIDPALELDPTDTSAFSTGITYLGSGKNVGVTMKAITYDTDAGTSTAVNEPVTLPLIALGLLALLRRRTQKA